MKDAARYAKIVEWSEEDQCFVGSAPGLVYGGCHGADERAVFDELCQIVGKRSRSIERMVRPCQWPHLAEILQTSCRTWRSGGSDGGGNWVAAQGSQRGLCGPVYRAAIQRRGLAASDDGAIFGHEFAG